MTRPGPDSPVVGLDLDGTLGDYHGHFERFAREWTGRDIRWDPSIEGSFRKQLGMGQDTYRRCKLAYRRGGAKRSMPVLWGAKELTRNIRAAGAQVWFCTTRPYLSMEGIDMDTAHWAKRNGLQFDAMLLGEHKYRDLQKQAGQRVVVVLDDDLSQIQIAKKLGFAAILRRNPANKHYIPEQDQEFVWDLPEAQEAILQYLEMHKRRAGMFYATPR